MRLAWWVLGFFAFFHVASCLVVLIRIRVRQAVSTPARTPLVTLIRPVRGLENHLEAALRSSFRLNYANLELLFCVEEESDPVVPLVRRLIAEHPKINARLLV